jgi:hypothetical protein
VAIKEGVYKTLPIIEDHFKGLYAGVPFDYFLYDSAKLGQVRNFATSSNIQIMVVTRRRKCVLCHDDPGHAWPDWDSKAPPNGTIWVNPTVSTP